MSLLHVEEVSKHFGSLIAVNDVSMTVEPGELRAVIGPNGAGKTTFFNLISGFLQPTSGRVIFDGEDITGLLPARRVWRGIARTFQVTEVFPELTRVREFAHPGRSRFGISLAAVAVATCRCRWSGPGSPNCSTWEASPARRIASSGSLPTAISAQPKS